MQDCQYTPASNQALQIIPLMHYSHTAVVRGMFVIRCPCIQNGTDASTHMCFGALGHAKLHTSVLWQRAAAACIDVRVQQKHCMDLVSWGQQCKGSAEIVHEHCKLMMALYITHASPMQHTNYAG